MSWSTRTAAARVALLLLACCACAATANLRLANSESAVQVLPEGHGLRHELSAVALTAAADATDNSAIPFFLSLTVTCRYGSVSIAETIMDLLHATSLSCPSLGDQRISSQDIHSYQTNQISAYTTLGEAQLILASLVYKVPLPASCRLPRGVSEDLLTVQITGSSNPTTFAWRSQQAGDVCIYEPATSAFFRQLFPAPDAAVSTTVSLERRLILSRDSVRSTGADLIQISSQNDTLRYMQGTCDLLAAIAINVDASLRDKISTQVRHYNADVNESLMDVTLTVHNGSLQLRVASALRKRIRVFSKVAELQLLLGPDSSPVTAASFTLRGTLSDIQAFLPTVRYCGTAPDPKLSEVYFASDAMDVSASVSGPCSVVLGADGDLVKSYATVPIQVERLMDLGSVSLVALLPKDADATAAAASGLVILNTNQLWAPLGIQYAPGNVDDVTVELQLEADGDGEDDGVFIGVESNSLVASDQQQNDVSTYFQTMTRTQNIAKDAFAADKSTFSLASSHSSWLTVRRAELAVAFTTEQLQQVIKSLLPDDMSSNVACQVDFEAPRVTVCTVEYQHVNLLRIPRVYHASESLSAASGTISVSVLKAKPSAHADLVQRPEKQGNWCGLHVTFEDEKATEASFQFTRTICELAQSCRLAVSQRLATTLSLESERDQAIAVQAIQDVALNGEDLGKLRFFRLSTQAPRGFLVSDVTCTLAYALGVQSTTAKAAVRVLRRRVQLRTPRAQLAVTLSTVRVYSTAFGVRLHNALYVTLRETAPPAISADRGEDSPEAITKYDVIVLPNYKNLQLRTPLELVVREGSSAHANLSSFSVSTSWPKQLSASHNDGQEYFRWSIRSKFLSLVFENHFPAGLPSVIHRQNEVDGLEMRGSIADYQASMAAVSLGLSSELLRDKTFFRGTIEHQVVQISSVLQRRSKVQILMTSIANSAISGAFTLGITLSDGFYRAINSTIPSVSCSSASIQRSDTMDTIAGKVLAMACEPLPAGFEYKREVQVIRVNAVFPWLVKDLLGSFTLQFLGKTSTSISVQLTGSDQMRLKVLEVVTDAQLEVSRVDFASAFEWRITFGSATGRAADQIIAIRVATASTASFATQTTIAQRGLQASDLILSLLFPLVSLRVRDTSPVAITNALSLEFDFGISSGQQPSDFPDLLLLGSTLESSATHSLLKATMGSSAAVDENVRFPHVGSFRIFVFGRTTEMVSVDAEAADVDAAIRKLKVDNLNLVSVQRVSSSDRHPHLYNWTIEASHPRLLDVQVDDQILQTQSGIHINVTRVARGTEALVGVDSLSITLSTMDNTVTIAQRDVHVRVGKTELDLVIRLPLSFVSVARNQSVPIEGIVLDGFEIGLTLEIQTKNGGSLALLPTAAGQSEDHPVTRKSPESLVLQGLLSELNAVLRSHCLLYSSPVGNSALLDEIQLSLRSATCEATQVIPVEIVTSAEAPSLLLPVSQLTVDEKHEVDIRGLTLFFSDSATTGENDYHALLRDRSQLTRVVIQARGGFLTFSSATGQWREANSQLWSSVWKRELELSGSIGAVNAELSRLRYVSPLSSNSSSTNVDEISFTTFAVDDGSRPAPASASKSFSMAVRIRRRPLVAQILFNGVILSDVNLLSTFQDQRVSLRNTSVRVISSPGNVDDSTVRLDLSVSTMYGTLSLINTSRNSDLNASVTPFEVRLVANASTLTWLLGALQFVPRRTFNGPGQILFRVQQADTDDHSVLVEQATGMLPVFVDRVDRLPQWIWTSSGSNVSTLKVFNARPLTLPSFTISEENENEEPAAAVAGGISMANFFEDDMVLRAIVSATTGTLLHESVSTQTGDSSGRFDFSLTLEGRVQDLKNTLARIKFQAPARRLPPHYYNSSTAAAAQRREEPNITVTLTNISRRPPSSKRTHEASIEAHEQPQTAVIAMLRLEIAESVTLFTWKLKWKADREIITINEDEAKRIGDAFDLSVFADYEGRVEMEFVTRSGKLYQPGAAAAATDDVSIATANASSSLKIAAEDGVELQQIVSELFYAPKSDFNGFEVVQCRVFGNESELFLHVRPVNDAPTIVFTTNDSNSSSKWFNSPKLLLPPFTVQDVDADDVFEVHIEAISGALRWFRTPKEIFDGVTITGVNTHSLHIKTTLPRLNALFAQPQLQFTSDNSNGALPLSASLASPPARGALRICVHDGSAGVCEDLVFPILTFYELQVSRAPLKVSRHRPLNLSDVVNITHHRFEGNENGDEDDRVTLQIDTLNGVVVLADQQHLSCADTYEGRSALFVQGVARIIRASSVECLDAVLATASFLTTPFDDESESGDQRMRAPAVIRFELFNSEMELLAYGSADLEIVSTKSSFRKPRQLVVTAASTNVSSARQQEDPAAAWRGASTYARIADFALVEIQPVADQERFATGENALSSDASLVLELAFSCVHCRFFYAKYVPRVSYEFAATQGASAMRFIGPEAALNQVLAMLQVDLPPNAPSHQDANFVRLTLSPYDAVSAAAQDGTLAGNGGQHPRWNDTTEVPIARLRKQQSALAWRIIETQLVFRDLGEGESAFIHGVGLSPSESRGDDDDDDMELTLLLECVFGLSRITFVSENGAQTHLCKPNQPRLAIATSAKRVNRVLSSVQVAPNASEERVDLQFSFAVSSSPEEEETKVTATLAPLLSLYFLLQTPLEPPTLVLKHETETLPAVEDETADLGDWVTIQAPGGSSSGYRSEDDWFVASLVVHHGAIRVKSSVCCVHIRMTSDGRNVSILGTIATIQTALNAIRYRGDPDFSGNDTLHATIKHARVEDGGSTTSTAGEVVSGFETLIAVKPMNDPPVIQYSMSPPLKGDINSSTVSYTLTSIVISDVDIQPIGNSQVLSSRVRVNLSSIGGEFVILDFAALARVELLVVNGSSSVGEEDFDGNASLTSKQLVFEASLADANSLIRKTLFSTSRVSSELCALGAQEGITITVDDLGHGVETWAHLQTSFRIRDFECVADGDFDTIAATLELTLPKNPDDHLSYDQNNRKISIAGLSIAGAADNLLSPLRVTGTCNFKVQLEVQRVSIIALSQKQELLLTIWTPSITGASTISGTFSVQVDVLINGFHLKQTVMLYADAVAMRTQELLGQVSNGRSVAESIEAKLLVLYAPVIASTAKDQPLLRFHVDRVASPPSSASAQWTISVFNSPMQLPTPQVLSQSLIGAGTGASVSFASSIIGASLGGTFRLRLGDEVTHVLPFDASGLELQDALEALAAVEMVKVTKSLSPASWLVTFLSPSESIPLLVGVSQGLAPGPQLSDADKGVTLVNGTSIRVKRMSAGKGQGNLRNVVVGITRVDRIYRITTSADSSIKGSFALGFQDPNAPLLPLLLLVSTDAVASNAVAMRLDEGQLQSFGGRGGDSMQSRLLLALTQLGDNFRQWKGVHVEVTRGPQDATYFGYEWLVTFKHAPLDFPALVVSDSNRLEGTNALVQVAVVPASANQLGGFFQLSYRTPDHRAVLIPADATPDVMESVLNEALSGSSDEPNASFLGRVVVRKTRVDERSRVGFNYGVLFLEELSSSTVSPADGDLLVADGSLLTGLGAFARVNEIQTRSSTGSFELLAARGAFRDSSSRWSGDLRFRSLPNAFVLETESVAQLQLALSYIEFQAPAHWYGTIQLQFSLDIIQSDSSGGSKRQTTGISLDTTLLTSGARRLSSIATATIPLAFDLPQVEISNDVDVFAIKATGGMSRQLSDFTIRLTGASATTTWLKLRLSCANGQLTSTTRSGFEPLGSQSHQVWINGTLTHIHDQLQNAIAFVALRESSELGRLTFSLFYSQNELQLAESEFLVRVSAPSVIPQLHIRDSIEGPFRSTLWEVMNMEIVHGETLKLPGIWIGDANSDAAGGSTPSISSDSITLEITCDSGSLRFSYFDDHLLRQTTDASGKTLILMLTGDLALLNRALGQLQYENPAKSSYRGHDMIRLSVRNDGVTPPFTHTRLIRLSIRHKVLMPCVTLGSLTYTCVEDTGFRFPDLTLEFPADLVSDDSSSNSSIPASPASYYHQLWSTELVELPLKRQYPQMDSGDDWRHRWVQDFPGRVVSSPPGSTLPKKARFCASGNLFYFQGCDEAHGRELWVSDGSSAGTHMLADLVPGPESSEPTEMTLLNGKVLFAASGLDLSWALGTDSCNGFRTSSLDVNVVYLVSKSSVWTPSADYDCLLGYRWMTTAEASRLFPTQEEAELLDERRTDHNLTEPYVFWSSCQWTGYTFGGVQRKLFRFSDSRVSGATKHAGRRDSAPVEVSFATTDFAGIVCIKSDLDILAGGGAGRELWTTDGTAPNTRRVLDLRPGSEGSNPNFLTPFKSQTLVFFQAETSDYGAELYKTDGTESGTILVEDIWRGPRSSSPSSFAEWTAGDSRMFFAATTDDGRELWATDGLSSFTAERLRKTSGAAVLAGTTLVRDICAGGGSSDPQFLIATTLGVFFSANDCVNGRELWITDGTTGGTRLVKDLNPTAGQDSSPSHLVLFSGKVYFQAQATLALGFELYVSDGTAAGTLLLADLVPGSVSSSPSLLSNLAARDTNNAIVSSTLYFGAYDTNVKAPNLWKSDGSRSGTAPLLDELFLHDRRLRLDASTGVPGAIFTFQNAVYYFVESTSALSKTRPVLTSDATFQLSISVNAGLISSTGIDNAPAPTWSLSTTGSFADLARVLEGLVYVPEQNWNFHRDRGQVVEWLFSVKHGDDVQETYVDLLVAPRVDAPVIQVPLSVEDAFRSMGDFLSRLRLSCLPLACDEDAPLSLRGLAVGSADGDISSSRFSSPRLLLVKLSIAKGNLAFSDTKCVEGSLSQAPQAQVTFTADIRCANVVLASATYIGDPHFSGSDALRVHVTDTESLASDDATIPLLVREVNDAPYLATLSEHYECDEDIPLVIRDVHIVDPDIPADQATLSVTIRAAFGSVALLHPSDAVVSVSSTSGAATGLQSELTLRGTLWDVNSALSGLVFTSANDWNSVDSTFDSTSDGYDSLTFIISDALPTSQTPPPFNSSTTSVRFVYVRPLADAVVINIPGNDPASDHAQDLLGAVHGDEDTPLRVHNLSFSSVDDMARVTLTVSLQATHGDLTLFSSSSVTTAVSAGVTFLDKTRNGDKFLRFKGTFASLNRAVRELQYLPEQDFNGLDQIVATATTLDEYTMEESHETMLTIDVTIDAVNDPPVWDTSSLFNGGAGAGPAAVVDPKVPTLISGIQIRDVDATDALCAAAGVCAMDVVIEVVHGTISLPRLDEDHLTKFFIVNVLVQDPGYLALSGTLAHLNLVLHEILFTLDDIEALQVEFRPLNEVALVLTVDDRGTQGNGDVHVSSTVVYVALRSDGEQQIHGLSLKAPSGSVIAIQEDSSFPFNGSVSLFDADVALSTASLLEVNVSTMHGAFALSAPVPGIQMVHNDSNTTVFRGFLSQVNAALTGSVYIPARDWYGSEQVSISATDVTRAFRRASTVVYFAVAPVCDEPTWQQQPSSSSSADNGAFATLREDEKLLIDSLSLTSPDAHADEHEVTVQITVQHGGVMLATYQGLLLLPITQFKSLPADLSAFPQASDTKENAITELRLFFSQLEVRGRLSDVNRALRGLIYEPNQHFHSSGQLVDEIHLLASAGCGGENLSPAPPGSSMFTVRLRIQAVNDPPVLLSKDFVAVASSLLQADGSREHLMSVLPAPAVEATEDSDLRLEPVVVQDPDQHSSSGISSGSPELQLLVNISCVHCSIRSSAPLSQHGLFVSSTSHLAHQDLEQQTRSSKSVAVHVLLAQGALASLNSAFLSSLVFRSAPNFHGVALVVVQISDLGNFGLGGARTSMYAQTVRVKSVDDGPQIYLPPYGTLEPLVQVQEKASVLLQGAPSVDELLSEAAAARDQPSRTWQLMLVQPLASDSASRFVPLGSFPGSEASAAGFFALLGDKILFRGHTTLAGDELWESDGTAAGTMLLKDIYPGSLGSGVSHLTPFSVDSRVYFAARGLDLSWRVRPDLRDSCASFRQSAFDANVFFAIAQGTTWEPDQVYDCPFGFRWMSTAEAQAIFLGSVAIDGHSSEPLAYFNECGWNGYLWGGVSRMYLRFSDSRDTGAFKHVGYRDSYRIDTGFQTNQFAGIVCYRDQLGGDDCPQQIWGPELWATDGTAEGTRRVKRINSNVQGSSPAYFAEFQSLLYFQATSFDAGTELWVTDGTRQSTVLVADIEVGSRSSEPKFLTVFAGLLVFSATTVLLGREPWFSDGTRREDYSLDHSHVGTGVLLDVCVGPASSNPQYFTELTVGATKLLLFQADDCVHGAELWVSSGNAESTRLVADIRTGATGSSPSYLTAYANRVYFQADDGVHGQELWSTDGTGAGTTLLADLALGVASSSPSFLTLLSNVGPAADRQLVFAAQSERDRRWEFWQSDGTLSGTTKLLAGSREVLDLNVATMDAMATPRFLGAFPANSQSFVYFDKAISSSSSYGLRAKNDDVAKASVDTRSITLFDVESTADAAQYQLNLNCSKGFVSLGRTCDGVTFLRGSQSGSVAIALQGALTALNCALERVTYHATTDVAGWDTVFVTLEQTQQQQPNDGDGRLFAVTKRIPIEIRAVNDAPQITMATTYFALLDAWVDLPNLGVSDADAGDGRLFVQFKVHNGQLRVVGREAQRLVLKTNQGAVVGHAVDGSNSVLEFAATVSEASLIFQSLQYKCAVESACRDGTRDYITLYVDDNGFTGDGGARDTTATAVILVRGGA